MVRRLRIAVSICLCAIALLATRPLAAAEIHVTAEPNPVPAGESFTLRFEAESADGEPDLSPLNQDFEISGTQRQSQLSLIDGRFSKSTIWMINLIPRHPGQIKVPPIEFGGDSSPEMIVNVLSPGSGGSPAQKSEDMFIEVAATPRDPYVQAQAIYTLRLYYDLRLNIEEFTLTPPDAEAGDAIVTPIGKERKFDLKRDGRNYKVYERIYAVFPQKHGTITLRPVVLEGLVSLGARSLLDPFGHDIRRRRVQSDAVKLAVRPVPKAFTGAFWLPAASLQLHETWSDDPDSLKAGDPITRTISLLASGLTAGQLPELTSEVPAGLKRYPSPSMLDDQKKSEGVIGLRQEQHALIAEDGGDYTLRQVRVPWWNTATDKMEFATLPARALHVQAGASAPAPTPPALTPQPAEPPAPALARGNAVSPPTPDYWRWISAALAGGWTITALLWWRSARRRPHAAIAGKFPALALRQSARRVLSACGRRDAALVRDALLAWAAKRWPADPPRSLAAIAGRRPLLRPVMEDLNRHLYGASGEAWDAAALASAFKAAMREEPRATSTRSPALEPLYKTAANAH